jgi:signal transduction histidine kinase
VTLVESTEASRLRLRAEQAEERLRAHNLVLAEAEHRLKTRMAVIAAWSATLDDRWDELSEAMRREGIAVIRRSAGDVARQASQLLSNARAGLVVLDLRPRPTPLRPLLEDLARSFSRVAPDHVVLVDADPDLRVEADPAALTHALEHLLENALAYSAAGTTVLLRGDAGPRGSVVIEVVDEGFGIPDGDLFAAFSRGSSSEGTSGAGLGLYIVRNLVEGMGGGVTAVRNRGAGSTFAITLPGSG